MVTPSIGWTLVTLNPVIMPRSSKSFSPNAMLSQIPSANIRGLQSSAVSKTGRKRWTGWDLNPWPQPTLVMWAIDGKLLFKFHPLHFFTCTLRSLYHQAKLFEKKASQGSKNKIKKYGSFDLGLSSAEGNRKNGSLARYQNLKLLLLQQYHCWCYNSSGDWT